MYHMQVIVTEGDGAVSTSEARSVAIAQRGVGTGLTAEPPAPLPLQPDTSSLGDFVMRSYMPRVASLCVLTLLCHLRSCTSLDIASRSALVHDKVATCIASPASALRYLDTSLLRSVFFIDPLQHRSWLKLTLLPAGYYGLRALAPSSACTRSKTVTETLPAYLSQAHLVAPFVC